MNADVELHIRNNYPWAKLPNSIRQLLGNSQKEYEKCVVQFSIRNQLRFKGSLVRHVRKDEERYYEEMLDYSKQHLMLYPYHLSDVFVRGLRVTPFQYYISMVEAIMNAERSYDALPNFTAADCLRQLGIGRNQYIELMNQCKSARKLFRKKNPRDLLPVKPIASLLIEPWWKIYAGFITEDDIKIVTPGEKEIIDNLIDNGPQKAGGCNYYFVRALYMKGLVYIDVPIEDSNFISVPPLEGFVMNRVLGDYLETLLYKIFVSIDEQTSVGELASVLQIEASQVRNAVSLYCRLGFARKKGAELEVPDLHPSWKDIVTPSTPKSLSAPMALCTEDDPLLLELSAALAESENDGSFVLMNQINRKMSVVDETDTDAFTSSLGQHSKRIAFIFDSSLTAFLMMGNLSQGLKSHAVTMFEVGKLSDESLDSLISELNRISTTDSEGEAQRYFEHALTLRHTIGFLRHSKALGPDIDAGLDLIRCESLQSLDSPTCARLLSKNYRLLVSMAPLCNELRLTSSALPPHWGPPLPEFSSIWFKLFLYSHSQMGPPSLLLKKGARLRKLPRALYPYDRLLITPWGHEPGIVPITSALVIINDALTHSPVLVQGSHSELDKKYVAFPLLDGGAKISGDYGAAQVIVEKLASLLDLQHTCGFITLIGGGKKDPSPSQNVVCNSAAGSPKNGIKDKAAAGILEEELDSLEGTMENKPKLTLNLEECGPTTTMTSQNWTLLTLDFGLPLFDLKLNEEVSEHIKEAQLCRKESLEAWVAASEKLSTQLLDFISTFQDLPVGGDCHTKTGLVEVPLPTKNLLFDGDQLYPWDGQ